MAATGNEVPLLSQLLKLKNWISDKLESKLNSSGDPLNSMANFVPGIASSDNATNIVAKSDGQSSMFTMLPTVVQTTITGTDESTKIVEVNENGLFVDNDRVLTEDDAPSVDIVKVTEHSTSYTKDTLEIICDSTGKVTAMYFVSI